MSGFTTIRASNRADSRFVIKNIGNGVIYVIGMWSKGDIKYYDRNVENIVKNLDFKNILKQLNSEERDELIIQNLTHIFNKYNSICEKIKRHSSNK